MRQLRIDYRRPAQPPARPPQRQAQNRTPRCAWHPGVHMVLAGTNPRWNTIRYLCPMCNAMGRPPVEVATGVVSGYWIERGYGFIDNGGPRIFFHVSDWQSQATPYVGMPVTCYVEQNDKGLVGRQVQPR
jgi:cold shock CspA family protein